MRSQEAAAASRNPAMDSLSPDRSIARQSVSMFETRLALTTPFLWQQGLPKCGKMCA